MGEAMPAMNEKILCACLGVTESDVKKAIAERNLGTLKDVIACTRAGEGCNSCHASIKSLIDAAAASSVKPALPEWAQPFFSSPNCSVR